MVRPETASHEQQLLADGTAAAAREADALVHRAREGGSDAQMLLLQVNSTTASCNQDFVLCILYFRACNVPALWAQNITRGYVFASPSAGHTIMASMFATPFPRPHS